MLQVPRLLELDRRHVAERAVKAFVIVFATPVLEQDLRLEQRVEELTVEELVA